MFRMGILGAGNIAHKMAYTVEKLDGVEIAAVASRDIKKASEFAEKHGIKKAYGSYDELAKDDTLNLIYVATPHSHHFEHTMLCLENGRNVMCEKAFMLNAQQTKTVLDFAKEKNLFITEAIWTRFLPFVKQVKELLDGGVIGKVRMMEAHYCFECMEVERMKNPLLAGGALLDLGIYSLTAMALLMGTDYADRKTTAVLTENGVDARSHTVYTWKDGRMAAVNSAMDMRAKDQIRVYGESGYAEIDNVANWSEMRVYDSNEKLTAVYKHPEQISGYEYEVLASVKAIEEGKIETDIMPHDETLRMMSIMDDLRNEWGMKYPMEK